MQAMMSVMTYGINIIFGILSSTVVTSYGVYYKIQQFVLFAPKLVGIFDLSSETKVLCIKAIRIITLGYIFMGANIEYQAIFQALGKGMNSLIISLIRLIIVTLPLAYIFAKLSNAQNTIWMVFPIAEAFALVVSIIFMRKVEKSKIDNLDYTIK